CPSAGPTGGAGVAFPPGICNLTCLTTFFFSAITQPPSFVISMWYEYISHYGVFTREDILSFMVSKVNNKKQLFPYFHTYISTIVSKYRNSLFIILHAFYFTS